MENIKYQTLELLTNKHTNKIDIEKNYEDIIHKTKQLIKQIYINKLIEEESIKQRLTALDRTNPNSKKHLNLINEYKENIKKLNNFKNQNIESLKIDIYNSINEINEKHRFRLNDIINNQNINKQNLNIALKLIYDNKDIINKIKEQKNILNEIKNINSDIKDKEETKNKINKILSEIKELESKNINPLNIFKSIKLKKQIETKINELETLITKQKIQVISLNEHKQTIKHLDKLLRDIKENKDFNQNETQINQLYNEEIEDLKQKKAKIEKNKIETHDNYLNEKLNEYIYDKKNNYISYIIDYIINNQDDKKPQIFIQLLLIINLLNNLDNYYINSLERLKEIDYELILINTILDDKNDEKSLESKINLQNKIFENIDNNEQTKSKIK